MIFLHVRIGKRNIRLSVLGLVFQVTENFCLGFLGKRFGARLSLVFVLAGGLDQFAHSGELGGQVAAQTAHHEVDAQPDGFAFFKFAIHLLAAQLICVAAAQAEHLENRAHHSLHHSVGDGRRIQLWMRVGFHGWIPFS